MPPARTMRRRATEWLVCGGGAQHTNATGCGVWRRVAAWPVIRRSTARVEPGQAVPPARGKLGKGMNACMRICACARRWGKEGAGSASAFGGGALVARQRS